MHTIRNTRTDDHAVVFVGAHGREQTIFLNLNFYAACRICNFLNGGASMTADQMLSLQEMDDD